MKVAIFVVALLLMVTGVAIATNRLARHEPAPKPASAANPASDEHDSASATDGVPGGEPTTMAVASLGLLAIGASHRRFR